MPPASAGDTAPTTPTGDDAAPARPGPFTAALPDLILRTRAPGGSLSVPMAPPLRAAPDAMKLDALRCAAGSPKEPAGERGYGSRGGGRSLLASRAAGRCVDGTRDRRLLLPSERLRLAETGGRLLRDVPKRAARRRRVFEQAAALPSAWDAYMASLDGPIPDRATQEDLARRARGGDEEARAALINANRRFVVQVAKEFRNRGLEMPDLVAEGNIGLLRAADKFDPDVGVKFISFAVHYIKQAMRQAIAAHGAVVRIPTNRQQTRSALLKAQRALEEEHGRPPSVGDLAKAVRTGPDVVVALLALQQAPVSLDSSPAEDRAALGDRLVVGAGATGGTPLDTLLREEVAETLAAALLTLSDRERLILTRYYGLDGNPPCTLEGIGPEVGLTRERIRQIREAALAKLRREARLLALELAEAEAIG